MSGGLDKLTVARIRFARACGALREASHGLTYLADEACMAATGEDLERAQTQLECSSQAIGSLVRAVNSERVRLGMAMSEAAQEVSGE